MSDKDEIKRLRALLKVRDDQIEILSDCLRSHHERPSLDRPLTDPAAEEARRLLIGGR